MSDQDCMNGLQHSLAEIDHAIMEATPATQRNMYQGEAWAAIDELLDQRNLVTDMMSEMIMDEYIELMDGHTEDTNGR